jgi:hypothetical protein
MIDARIQYTAGVHETGRNLHIQAEARACARPPVDPQTRPSLMSESRHVVFEPMSSVFGSVPGALTAGECAISCPPGTRLVHLRRVAAGANDYARRRVGLFVSNSQHWIVLRCRFVVVLASATALLFYFAHRPDVAIASSRTCCFHLPMDGFLR